MPKEVIDRANEILSIYETKPKKGKEFQQIELQLDFNEGISENDKIIEKLTENNPLQITPIDALNILYELKKNIKK